MRIPNQIFPIILTLIPYLPYIPYLKMTWDILIILKYIKSMTKKNKNKSKSPSPTPNPESNKEKSPSISVEIDIDVETSPENYDKKKNDDFEKIKEMETMIFALKEKYKDIPENIEAVYEFILKSKYIVFKGYHNRRILVMFYDSVMEYFKDKTKNKNCMVIDGKIIYTRKTN